jgi:hypothetical protein
MIRKQVIGKQALLTGNGSHLLMSGTIYQEVSGGVNGCICGKHLLTFTI